MAKSKETFSKAWAKIVAKAWTDEEFKAKLLKNPEKVLKEMGVNVPSGVKLELHEQKAKNIHLILPAKPQGALSEQELKAAAGGVCGAGTGMLEKGCGASKCAGGLETKPCMNGPGGGVILC